MTRKIEITLVALCLAGIAQVVGAQNATIWSFRTSNGHFLTAVNGGGLGGPASGVGATALNTDRTQAQGWEIFSIVPVGNQQYAIKTANGDVISAIQGGGIGGPNDSTSPIHADAISVSSWESFVVTPVDATHATIQTCDGHYLTANNGGGFGGPDTVPIHTDAKKVGTWETFSLVPATCPFVFNAISISVNTGGDDARSDSTIVATLPGQSAMWCVKTGALAPCKDPIAVGWPNGYWIYPATFPLSPPITVMSGQYNFPQLSIGFSSQQNQPWQGYDNWNMSGILVTLSDAFGHTQVVLSLNDPAENCLARFYTINSSTYSYRQFNLSAQPDSVGTTPFWSPLNANVTPAYGSVVAPSGC